LIFFYTKSREESRLFVFLRRSFQMGGAAMKRVLVIVLASRDEFFDHASSALSAFEKNGQGAK
jgi:hypothetical protein